jgi:hypothetical protein
MSANAEKKKNKKKKKKSRKSSDLVEEDDDEQERDEPLPRPSTRSGGKGKAPIFILSDPEESDDEPEEIPGKSKPAKPEKNP